MDTVKSNGNFLSMTGIDDITEIYEDLTELTSDVLINNAKVGITIQQSYDIELNNNKVGITIQQSNDIVANNNKVGITIQQTNDIIANNNKVGITTQQSNDIVANNNKVGITIQQAENILTNNAKIGISLQQSANILTNNAKIGITEAQMAEIEKVIAIEETINSHGSILTQVVLKTDTEYINNSKLVINGDFNMGSLTLTDFVKLEGENFTIEPDFGDTLPRTLVVSSRNSSSQIIIKDIGTTNNGGGFLKYDSVTGVFSIGSIANNETLVDMIKFLPNETTADIYMPYGDLIVNGVSVLTTRTDLNNLTNTVSDLDTLVTVGLSASIAGLTAGAVVIGTTISGLSAVVTGHTASIALKEDKITGLSDITMKDLNCGNITMRGFADFFDFQDADLDLDGKIKCEKSITAEGAITGGSLKSWNTDINAFGVKTNYVKTGDENIIPELIEINGNNVAIDCYGDIDLHGCRIRNVNNINMSGSSITNMSELTFKEGGESHIQNIKQITGQHFSITPTDATFGGRAISSLQTAVQVGGLIAAGIALLANSSDLTNEVNARIQAIDEINNTLFYPSVKYVKLLDTGNPTNVETIINLAELEVFGIDGTTNLALGKTVTGSGWYNSTSDGTKLVDGSYNTAAHTAVGGTNTKFMMVNLGAVFKITKIKITNITSTQHNINRAIGIKVQLIQADGVTIIKEHLITTGLPSYTFQYTPLDEKIDNEIDARIQADADLQTAIDTKASTVYVNTAIANLVDSSPATLNTLNELAEALGDDPNFATTVTDLIGAKANTADVVNITQNQIITGYKTFQNDNFLVENSAGSDKISVNGTTTTIANDTININGVTTFNNEISGQYQARFNNRVFNYLQYLRLGSVLNFSFLDYRSGGNSADYDVRVSSYGGTSAVGYGAYNIDAGTITASSKTGNILKVNSVEKIKTDANTTTIANTTIAINGATTFDTVIIASQPPTANTHLTNKLFVETADATLQTNINTVSTGLSAETTNRTNADADLQLQITNINSGTSGANLVHIDTAETITGAKTFTQGLTTLGALTTGTAFLGDWYGSGTDLKLQNKVLAQNIGNEINYALVQTQGGATYINSPQHIQLSIGHDNNKIYINNATTTLNNTTTKIQSGGADKINVNGTTTTLTNNTINLASYPSVRYIKLYHSILNTIINLWELEAYTADGTNVALNKNVTSSVGWFSTNTGDKLVNGNYADMAHTSFPNNNTNYYILVDLGANFPIKGVKIWNRWDGGVTGSATRAIGIKVQLMDADGVTILKENTITTTEETYTYNYSSDKMVTNATETTLTNNAINLAIDNGDVKYQHTDQFTLIRNDRVYLASTSGSGFALEINGLGSDGATTLLNNVTNKIQSGFGNDKITVNASTNTLNNTTTKIQSGGADKINVTGTTTTLNNTTTKIQSGLEVKMVTNETTTTLTNTTINFATEDIRVNNIPLITQIWGFYQKGSSFFGNNWLNHAPIRDNDVDGCVGMVSCVDILPYAISVAVENDGATATETGNVTFYVRCIDYTDPANQGLKRRSDLQNLGFNLMDVGQCVISMGNDVTDYAVLSSTQYIPAGTPFGIFFTEGITNFAAEVTVKLFCSQGRQGILQNPGLDLQ